MSVATPLRSYKTMPTMDDENGFQALRAFSGDANLLQQESPAYKALREAGLIVDTYALRSAIDLDMILANSDMTTNCCRLLASGVAVPIIGAIVYRYFVQQFSVKEGHVRCATHSDGSYLFFGAGVHRVKDPFLWVEKEDRILTESRIEHGNRAIITVPQGFVGLAFDRGQPVILPPGLHQWKSDTLKFEKMIDLSSAVIRIGPFTLLTVDEGYAAVTQDNGKQRVLAGGQTHMLTHRNWKFESFMSLKIHTDDLGVFSATTADNVVLQTNATVNWRIEDPAKAVLMAADTMPGQNSSGNDVKGGPVVPDVLKRDVLKQALASLAAAMGTVRYSDDTHVSASDKLQTFHVADDGSNSTASPEDDVFGMAQIFSVKQMSTAVRHANEICSQYGVLVVSINVISAFPTDPQLQQMLGAGAVATAAATQAEVAARGNAKAKLIASQSEAEAMRIGAQATADAERLKAQGKKDAAALLEVSEVAVDLAKIERTGELMGDKTTFFFGAGPNAIPALLSNPKLTATA